MKLRLKYLRRYDLITKDKEKAKVKDFLFDEQAWKIRYIEADFGSFLSDKRILIPQSFISEISTDNRSLTAELTKDEIAKCPAPEAHLPVSKEFEIKVRKYHNLKNYWQISVVPPANMPEAYFPPRPIKTPARKITERDIDTRLRSFKELKAYSIEALDGSFGEVHDFIMDDTDRQIIWLIIDTEGWLPWSKKLMVSIKHLEQINFPEEKIYMNLNKENLKDAPEFFTSDWRDDRFQRIAFDYFGNMPGPGLK